MADDNSATTMDFDPFVPDQLSSDELSFLMDVCNLTNSQERRSNDLLNDSFDQLSEIETSQYEADMSHPTFVQSEVSNKDVCFEDNLFSEMSFLLEIGQTQPTDYNESASYSDLAFHPGLFDNDNSIGQVISVNKVTESNVFNLSYQLSSEPHFSDQLSSFQTSSFQLSLDAVPSDVTIHNGMSLYQSSPSKLSSQSLSEGSDHFLLTPGYF
jgi:hypothetical protein